MANAKLNVYVKVDPEMRKQLDIIARSETRTISNVIYVAIQKYLKGRQ